MFLRFDCDEEYLGHISGISYGACLGNILDIFWAYLGHILGISWADIGHILGISSAYLGHSLSISWLVSNQGWYSRLAVKVGYQGW